MARVTKPSDPLVVARYTERGGLLRGVRRSGQIIARHASGTGHSITGTIKPELTPNGLATAWRGRFPGCIVRVHCDEASADRPILTQAKADAKANAARRRAQIRADQDAAHRTLGGPL